MFGRISTGELIIIVAILLLFLGARWHPDNAQSLGEAATKTRLLVDPARASSRAGSFPDMRVNVASRFPSDQRRESGPHQPDGGRVPEEVTT